MNIYVLANVMNLSPKNFDLPPRTILEQIDNGTIALCINRKSRIVMADGKKILEKSGKIRKVYPDCVIALKTTAPVCSKTKKFLQEEGIQLIPVSSPETP